MKLLVTGATGPTGQHLVTQAAAAGHQATTLVCDAAKVRLVILRQVILGPDLLPLYTRAKAGATKSKTVRERLFGSLILNCLQDMTQYY